MNTLILIRDAPAAICGGQANEPQRWLPEKELIKAQLVTELMDFCGYPAESICVDVLIYAKDKPIDCFRVDVLAQKTDPPTVLLFGVETPGSFEKNYDLHLRHLFAAASQFKPPGATAFLVYYTRWYEQNQRRTLTRVVEGDKFKNFEGWQGAGRPSQSEIPRYSR